MKALLLLICVFSFSSGASAQNWCHQGAKWSYNGSSMGGSEIDVYTYSKDTMVSNRPCHQLSLIVYGDDYYAHYHLDTATMPPLYTYADADTIYFFQYNTGKWQAEYHWGANVGDTLIIPNSNFNGIAGDTVVHGVVDSTGVVLIDTNHLRYYTFHLIDSCQIGISFHGKVIERIGVIDNDIVPSWLCATDGTYYGLCSYQDDSFALYPSGGCPSLPNGINEVNEVTFKIQPNPARDEVMISLDNTQHETLLSISDMEGKQVLTIPLLNASNKISISNLANGIYLVIITQNSQRTTQKLVVAR